MVVMVMVVERWQLYHLGTSTSYHRGVKLLLLLGRNTPAIIRFRSGITRPQIQWFLVSTPVPQ
jgi:hypothetical protein